MTRAIGVLARCTRGRFSCFIGQCHGEPFETNWTKIAQSSSFDDSCGANKIEPGLYFVDFPDWEGNPDIDVLISIGVRLPVSNYWHTVFAIRFYGEPGHHNSEQWRQELIENEIPHSVIVSPYWTISQPKRVLFDRAIWIKLEA